MCYLFLEQRMRVMIMHYPYCFGILKLALNVACMFAGRWAAEKLTCLYIHMWYSQVFVASLNLTVIRIAELQADK